MRVLQTTGVAASLAALIALSPIAPASAINNIKGFGVQETLKDFYSLSDFSSEIGYTVTNLRPSRDPIAVNGRLYEANVTSTAVVGTVFPQVPNFIARSPGGTDYRALIPASTLSGAALGPGGTASGKLYFDVVGENPDSVVYNDQSQDLLGWVGVQPPDPAQIVPGTEAGGATSGGTSTATGAGTTEGSGTSGGNLATPPSVSNGAQNGSYGPSGNTPPVGNN